MSSLFAPFPRRAGPARGAALLATALVVPALTACSIPGVARTKETTYLMDGKTYLLQEFTYQDQHNFTLFEIVDGERSFVALHDRGKEPPVDVFGAPIPEEEGHLRTIMTVVQNGEQQGETVARAQRTVDLSRAMSGDFGG